MDKHQGVSGPCCDQIGSNDRFPDARRRNKDSGVLTPESPYGLLLNRREPPFERNLQRLPFAALVLDEEGSAMFAKDLIQFSVAPAGKRNVLR